MKVERMHGIEIVRVPIPEVIPSGHLGVSARCRVCPLRQDGPLPKCLDRYASCENGETLLTPDDYSLLKLQGKI